MHWYFIIGGIFGAIFAVIFIIALFGQLFWFAWKWINDIPNKKDNRLFLSKWFPMMSDEDFTLGILGGSGCLVFFFLVGWPFILAALLVLGILLGLRGFVRFKKKVNQALEVKEVQED
ncbi:hypothetical protein KAR91_42800 [Candidatus Pacearchaeota archaeon]|nr:hypothetical protein [Candidatus Pacearchaeota archaeon]